MTKNVVVQLNQLVGCHLLTFLDGIDAINFIEVVNDSEQFRSIAKTSDHHFIESMKVFRGQQKIILPHAQFGSDTDVYQIYDGRLIMTTRHYSSFIEPSVRLYIHPCFSIKGFMKLCEVYKTSLFKCYSRLLPLNTVWYTADFGLLNYELYIDTIGLERALNNHERKLFKGIYIERRISNVKMNRLSSF